MLMWQTMQIHSVIDEQMFYFTVNFIRESKIHKDQTLTWSSVLISVMCKITHLAA